jgi:hypothetical protein
VETRFVACAHDHAVLFLFDERRQRRAERVDPLCLVTPREEVRPRFHLFITVSK